MASAALEEATEHQGRARVALTAALAARAVARLPLPRAARGGQAGRGAGLRGGDRRRRGRRPRRRPPPRPARPLAAPRPRLARPARRPAHGRRGARAGDPRRRLPALRRRAPGLRRRGRRGDARREPERAAEDAGGAAVLRPPDPAHLRARRPAGDDRLALPAGRLRAAPGRGAGSAAGDDAGGGGRERRRRSPPRRGSPPATSSGRACCSRRPAASCAPRSRRCIAATLADELSGAPWRRLLDRATAAGEEAEGAAREALEEESQAGIKRTAKDITDGAKRAGRRRRTEILDLGLELTALWLRDLAALAAGAEEVVFDRDRLDVLRAPGGQGRPGLGARRRRRGPGHPPRPRPQRLRGARPRSALLPPRPHRLRRRGPASQGRRK